ncbi:virginiamycin B lyase family protein [Chromatocurvus halotolerans]|uniref:Virginiamycin B lyase n=1 Tax=Chromatocurvus halotolerans TaxID=1132028 RepID=A0A4R2KJD0_9GAMM|nr:cytochrome C [Chromatocurvus halotolerans]TCO70709.1 virginiamycin B lyase [Chromatocurvus halotolerans]
MQRCLRDWVVLSLLAAMTLPVVAAREISSLPEGDEKNLVEAVCSGCHSISVITRSAGFASAAEWRALIDSMVDLADPQAETLASYLAQAIEPDESRRPTLVEGDTRIRIDEWLVPTLGQRSRDPVETPDGMIWWTGMWASLIGRLDPQSGDMAEYHLPPAARPHSIVPDSDGNLWYLGNSNATIGRLDPDTGLIQEYATEARDPHTGVFHPNGQFYFTAQHAGRLGRLDPDTGDIHEVETRQRPYGIRVGPEGRLWVAYNGTNSIGAMAPDSMEVTYFELPDPASRVRRLDLDSEGRVWFVNSSLGRIGRLDPATGGIQEWPSPSGPDSHPYALAVIDDVVWYNESGMRPDALVRFDPATEQFQSWAIPSGVGIIRHMWVTAAGELLIHQSSSNRVGRVRIEP